jgi:hypothetical protein
MASREDRAERGTARVRQRTGQAERGAGREKGHHDLQEETSIKHVKGCYGVVTGWYHDLQEEA